MSWISTSTRPYFLEVIVPKDLILEGRSQNSVFSNNILRERRRKREGKTLTKIQSKHLIETLIVDKHLRQVPRSEPWSIKKKKGAGHSPKYRAPTEKKNEEGPTTRDAQGEIQENGQRYTSGTYIHALR